MERGIWGVAVGTASNVGERRPVVALVSRAQYGADATPCPNWHASPLDPE
jgi:hypothetical protein